MFSKNKACGYAYSVHYIVLFHSKGKFITTATYNASIGFTSLGEQSSVRVVMMCILGFRKDEVA